ncbi:MFS transporter [Saccharopolyspora mangrovi]|uniref:MFS transporter n=1 Tax=Saccharopolyspora mangrovi TaxID=3082379 RepID=A0ABU6ABR6_9PSEU|nr:MFS transporter [Saccharopolyspora sp. S2-29]MEB3368898.1 MFS transporter [Saccharopolyspora sp. S2-29]
MSDETTIAPARPRAGLARYVLAATSARTADGGAVVAIVLLATTSGDPGWLAGALGACVTAPHLLGPFIARSLDTARDGRRVIALASLLHGVTLAAAVLLHAETHPIVPAVLLIASGLLGPLLTGGISSRLPAIAGPTRTSQRRAQGWDVATYGIGGTAGPSIVAALSAWASPLAAGLVLAAGAVIAAAFVMLLPYSPPPVAASDIPRPARTLAVMLSTGPLRRTLYLTMIVAFSVAALPITAVAGAAMLGTGEAAAGVLTAAYGLGNLAGSVGVMARPLEGNADRLMTRLAVVVATTLFAVVLSPTFGLAAAAYAAAGIANGYFFAATLAARSEYSPDEMRGQVFVWTGALKITAGSAGTALAGTLVTASAHLPLVLAIALTAAAALASTTERRTRSIR